MSFLVIGVAGIAPGVSIMPVKVLDSTGSETYTEQTVFCFATDNGVDAVNMSLVERASNQTHWR